ncbi:male-enhanced antigen 1 [Bicyclus anynana]|uniref:Male-enhanced antigen 1 n=1 Tax=Bicyclus anynana TaxID=110368 RepID=A0A6J1MR39_BICAN|nr:male-enhanced antigen 1 [Bicyclus anynana]
MVCDGPDPPDDSPQNLIPPPRSELMANGNHDDSDEEHEHFGYEPLAQGPEAVFTDHESDEDADVCARINSVQEPAANNVPPIEPMDSSLARETWNVPRSNDPIQMDTQRAQEVMSLMADFSLPQASIPEWAQSVSEEQWKQTLNDRIEKLRGNR